MDQLIQANLDEWRCGYLDARRSLLFSNAQEYQRRLKRMGILQLSHDAQILDFGSGDGKMIKILHTLGYPNVIGLEPDKLLLEEDGAAHSVVIGAGPEIPFINRSFDAIISNSVLHHLPDEETISKTITEFRRILRPGGLLAYVEPSKTVTRYLLTLALLGPAGRLSRFSRQKRLMVLNEWETLTRWLSIERDFPLRILRTLGFDVQLVNRGPLKTTVRAIAQP
jgi:SAM-dependent methyltransferase